MCLGDLPQLTAGFWAILYSLQRAALRRVLGTRQGRPPQDVVSSYVEHAARVRVEQRGVLDEEAARQRALHYLQRRSGWAHVHTQRGYGGGTVPSQGKASEAASPGSPGLVEASRPWNPLATAYKVERSKWCDGCRLCVNLGRYAARFGVRCAV